MAKMTTNAVIKTLPTKSPRLKFGGSNNQQVNFKLRT